MILYESKLWNVKYEEDFLIMEARHINTVMTWRFKNEDLLNSESLKVLLYSDQLFAGFVEHVTHKNAIDLHAYEGFSYVLLESLYKLQEHLNADDSI